MNRFNLLLLMIVATAMCTFANDTEVSSVGGELRPLKQTQINMEYEKVVLDCKKERVHVSVLYRFNNTGKKTTIKLAFVAPGVNDWGDHAEKPDIEKFVANVNGSKAKVSIKRFADGALVSPTKNPYADYAYTFDAPFHEGINEIRHTYETRYSGSATGMFNSFVSYILSSGANWAGGQIDTLRAEIKIDGEYVVNVYPLGDSTRWHPWKITNGGTQLFLGDGQNITDEYFAIESGQEFWSRNSTLYVDATHFVPKNEIIVRIARYWPSIVAYDINYGESDLNETGNVINRIAAWKNAPKDLLEKLLDQRIASLKEDAVFKKEEVDADKDAVVEYLKNRILRL